MVKRRDSKTATGSKSATDTPTGSSVPSPGGPTGGPTATDWFKISVPFKNPTFTRTFKHSIMISGKKRQWRTLKQILAQEAAEASGTLDSTTEKKSNNGPAYGSIDAPPSFKPAKKYSDISGLEANYTDPQTKLNYATATEYKVIKKLPSDLVAGYLTLRRANTQLQ